MRPALGGRPWVGLDIGSFSVKVLGLQAGVGGARTWLGESLLPSGPDAVGSRDDAIGQAIATAFSIAGLRTRNIRGFSLGIGGPDVIVKQISLPLLDDSEVGPALRFEARKHLPFDPQTMIVDYQILGRFPSERKLDILLAAVAQEHIDRHMAPLRLLGIEPDIVDPAPLALANAVLDGRESESGAQVVLDIGQSCSHVALYQRGQPFFTRRLDFGGRTITRAIAEATNVPPEEAEEWKLAAGADQPGLRVDWDSAELRAVLGVIRTELVEELRRSFAFYRTQGTLPDNLRLWVSGGSARLPGFAARLADLLGISVMLFDPVLELNSDRRESVTSGPQFAQAYGLALRAR